tara:strand:- start:1794 stop:3089 length:1296 start_codon:yes stop_codon:yes gene_type:complete
MFLKNKIVLIHIDAIRREYLSSWLLGLKFKEKGYYILLSSRHSTGRLLKLFTPAVFITTHAFTIKFKDFYRLKKNGTKIYINEVEGIDNKFGVSTTYPEFYCGEKINYNIFSGIFVWGKFTYKYLNKKNIINEKNLYRNGSIRQSKFCKPIIKEDNEKVIGIISRFEIINPYDSRHPFVNLIDLDPEDVNWKWYFERCAIDSETFSIVYKLIKKLIQNGYKVSLRAHPNEDINAYDKLKIAFGPLFEIDNSYDINEWLSSVSLVVGPTSTAFTEPYLAKIPVISISKIQKFKYNSIDRTSVLDKFDKSAYTPKTVNEAYSMCTSDKLKPKKSNDLDNYFSEFYTLDNKSDPIDNIVNIVTKNKTNFNKSKFENLLSFLIQSLFLYLCDFFFIIKNFTKSPISKNFNKLKQYNYNRFFHRPTSFMKKLNNLN